MKILQKHKYRFLVCLIILFSSNLFAKVHTGQIEVSSFVGRQSTQMDNNSTFSGGMAIGLEIVELGIIEFGFEMGFGNYPENKQRLRNFDLALKKAVYNGDMFIPYILAGVGLMTYNRTDKISNPNESKVTYAKLTTNFGLGFKVRIKKDFFAKFDQKYNLFSRDGHLTYRSLTALGVSYSF